MPGLVAPDEPLFINRDEAEFERWLDDIIGRGLSYRPDLDAAVRPGTGEIVERAPLGYAKTYCGQPVSDTTSESGTTSETAKPLRPSSCG
jgi:hypothetical protein